MSTVTPWLPHLPAQTWEQPHQNHPGLFRTADSLSLPQSHYIWICILKSSLVTHLLIRATVMRGFLPVKTLCLTASPPSHLGPGLHPKFPWPRLPTVASQPRRLLRLPASHWALTPDKSSKKGINHCHKPSSCSHPAPPLGRTVCPSSWSLPRRLLAYLPACGPNTKTHTRSRRVFTHDSGSGSTCPWLTQLPPLQPAFIPWVISPALVAKGFSTNPQMVLWLGCQKLVPMKDTHQRPGHELSFNLWLVPRDQGLKAPTSLPALVPRLSCTALDRHDPPLGKDGGIPGHSAPPGKGLWGPKDSQRTPKLGLCTVWVGPQVQKEAVNFPCFSGAPTSSWP